MNKNRIVRVLLATVSLAAMLVGTGVSAKSPATAATTKKLLWSQEFAGKAGVAPSSTFFKHDLGNGFGWGNAELEYYTAGSANMATDGKGNMVITARRIPDTSPILNSCDNCQFTSAKVTTAGKLGFKYGRLEARIKTPAGSGMWPAFWMLGSSLVSGNTWPDCGEIDILEGKGSEPFRAYGTVHGPGYFGGNGTQRGSVYDNNAPLSDGYHVYAIEWRPNAIDFYFDSYKYYTISSALVKPNKWVFNNEFYLIINLATGGNFEPNLDPNIQSATMSLDYIRYYSINGIGTLIKH